mgnify:CR=1 FL=1
MSSRHNFGSNFYDLSLKKILKIELLSFFGRLFSKKVINTDKKYLQLGCGDNYNNDSFIHCDFYTRDFFNIFKKKNFLCLDLRYKLPFNDNQFEGIFSEHTLEHLYPSEALKLLNEIYRILKPGGILRLVVPDLKIYINYYNNKDISLGRNYKFGCEAIWNLTQNFSHRTVWDSEMLIYYLKQNGFINCKEFDYRVSQNENLVLDKEGRKIDSIYVEATKQ